MTTTTTPLAVGVDDAARMVGTSTDTIRKAIHATEAPYLKAKRIGNRLTIAVADLQDWFDSLPDA